MRLGPLGCWGLGRRREGLKLCLLCCGLWLCRSGLGFEGRGLVVVGSQLGWTMGIPLLLNLLTLLANVFG